MSVDREHVVSFPAIFAALGLLRPHSAGITPPDITIEAIESKITNPQIARQLGANAISIDAINGIEWAANLLDSYSETGDPKFLELADRAYNFAISPLPSEVRRDVVLSSMAAVNYFHFERLVALRIRRGDEFLPEEAIEYLLRRGSDSIIYASVLRVDHITDPGLISGFRVRQALWDLADDVTDLEQDRLSIGANVLLLSTGGERRQLRSLARSLVDRSRRMSMPQSLLWAIDQQYQKTIAVLA